MGVERLDKRMWLCNNGHADICYFGNGYCPICELLSEQRIELDHMLQENRSLHDHVVELERRLYGGEADS
jgi:hypothetical protein